MRLRHRVQWTIDDKQVAADAASDGCFPLVANDRQMTGAQLLTAYKWQHNLEKRHAQLKGTQLVGPNVPARPGPDRGTAVLPLHRHAHPGADRTRDPHRHGRPRLTELSLYPEDRGCAAPTAARVLEIFTGVAGHQLLRHGRLVQTVQPELTDLQRQVPDLLDIPTSAYINPAYWGTKTLTRRAESELIGPQVLQEARNLDWPWTRRTACIKLDAERSYQQAIPMRWLETSCGEPSLRRS